MQVLVTCRTFVHFDDDIIDLQDSLESFPENRTDTMLNLRVLCEPTTQQR